MAGPVPAPAAPAIFRSGSRLIFPAPPPGQSVTLPALCVRCGQPASRVVKKTFSWHNPAIYLILLLSPLIYLIVAVIVRKMMRVEVPLCPHHAQRRSTAVTLAWVLPLIGLADIFILSRFDVDGGIVALITIAFMLAGLVIWAVVASPIRPKLIDQFHAEFSGFCEIFLDQFPQGSAQPAATPQQFPPPPPPIG